MKSTEKPQKAKTLASPSGSKKAPEAASKRPYPRRAQDFSGVGKTQQQFKQSCDVNIIVAHYAKTGVDPHAERIGNQIFGFATSTTYEEALRQTAEVQSAFAAQPSAIRSEFRNNAAAWLNDKLTQRLEADEKAASESAQEATSPPTPTPGTPESGSNSPESDPATTPVKKDG